MRPIDSAYDNREGSLTSAFIDAVRESGRNIETHVNGAVTIDGETWTSEEFDNFAHQWDSSGADADSIDDFFAE